MKKLYNEYCSVQELYEAYGIKPLSKFLTEADDKDNEADAEEKAEKELKEKTDKEVEDPDKVAKPDEFEVIYAEYPKKYNNIFKHIIVFTNDRDTKNNKTLKNIQDAVKRLKKDKADVIPELHVFVAAEIQADDDAHEIIISDGDEEFKITNESNLDTLVFARLGVQDEDNAEHIVKVLQDRGFLLLLLLKVRLLLVFLIYLYF